MGFYEDLQVLASKVIDRKDYCPNEETTKQSLIVPFLITLGYDVTDPKEVRHEYSADYASKKDARVDYAIFIDNKPAIFIEAKPVRSNLQSHGKQLEYYFNTNPDLNIAILTNGTEYHFFTDLENANIMDPRPFFKVNIENITRKDADILIKFRKTSFNNDEIRKFAEDLTFVDNLKDELREQFRNPSDDFIRFFIKKQVDTRTSANLIERYRPLIKRSIAEAILQMVSSGLISEIDKSDIVEEKKENEPEEQNIVSPALESKIVTTEEELEAFAIIKSLIEPLAKEPNQILFKDTTGYFRIFYRKPQQWITLLRFYQKKKTMDLNITIPEISHLKEDFNFVEKGDYVNIEIASLKDIYRLSPILSKIIRRLEEPICQKEKEDEMNLPIPIAMNKKEGEVKE